VSGLTVYSAGPIKVNNVTANGDLAGGGAYLDNCLYDTSGCTASATVTLTGINTFNNNAMKGLDVSSFGNILAADLNASDNGDTGVLLENDYLNENTSLASKGAVTLTGTNIFNGNGVDGLDVLSFGLIKGSNLHAAGNISDGVYLYNKDASTAQSVKLTNSNVFFANGSNGLEVYSNGSITLSSMEAIGNSGNDGVYLNNTDNGFTSNVTLTGNDLFDYNYNNGLEVLSNGMISLNTITLAATWNGSSGSSGIGVTLDNSTALTPKAVVIKGTNLFEGNYLLGLYVVSKGSITANNITANGSVSLSGVNLWNDTDDVPGAVGGVTLTGTNTFIGNNTNGLVIGSSGMIKVTNVTATDNGKNGIWLNNCMDTGSGCTTAGAPSVTLSGTNVANNNGLSGAYDGIYVLSKGTITANNLTAIGNSLSGAYLNNSAGLSTAGVTLTGASFFHYNYGGDGLGIYTNGKVTLAKITSTSNAGDGVYVPGSLSLTLTCGSFIYNGGKALHMTTTGTMTLIGLVEYANTSGDENLVYGSLTRIRTCTLP
jgi:hypothetical protein